MCMQTLKCWAPLKRVMGNLLWQWFSSFGSLSLLGFNDSKGFPKTTGSTNIYPKIQNHNKITLIK